MPNLIQELNLTEARQYTTLKKVQLDRLSSARPLITAGLGLPHGKSQLGFKRRALTVPN